MYTLDTLMKMNGMALQVGRLDVSKFYTGHTFIDILKIDIEGAEFDALTDLINHYSSLTPPQPLPFGQLQVCWCDLRMMR